MHVYLKNGAQRRWLIVQLDGGHAPRIAGFPVEEGNEVSRTLEPAIWFKLMVLDSVSIDCEKHVVCWTTSTPEESEESQGKEHLMFTDDDQYCYDFDDDLDELFNLAIYLINTNPMAELNSKRRSDLVDEYQRSLFRLLHCYILGKIELHPEDTSQVLLAHQMQLRAISLADEQVMVHKRITEQYKNQMREIRETQILPHIYGLENRGLFNKEIVELLKQDLLNDLEKVKTEVDTLQLRVDTIKSQMSSGTSGKIIGESLAVARSKRDVVVTRLGQLLQWRETILDHEATVKNKETLQPLDPVFVRYMELYTLAQKERELTLLICHRKVRAISVRECIESTLDDLEKGETSVGEEITVDGQKPTNINFESGSNAEWQTLAERLAAIVYNIEHPVGKTFAQFTNEIRQRCGETLRAYERLSNKSAIAEVDGYLIVDGGVYPFDREILKGMKESIQSHFNLLTSLLMESFNKQSQLFWRKLRLCYEKIFFHRIGDNLMQLYRLVNSQAVLDLESRVNRLRNFPVCKLGLQMKDEWWLSLFDPVDGGLSYRLHGHSDGTDLAGCVKKSARYSPSLSHDVSQNDTEPNWDVFIEDSSGNRDDDRYDVDFIREKLQVGTAKVLSRSWSCYDVDSNEAKVNPVREGAAAMVQDISSKVLGSRSFIAYDRIFKQPSTRKMERITENSLSQRCRSRSCSDILTAEHRNSLEQENKRARLTSKRRDTFERHFGSVLAGFRDVFSNPSPLRKMQCLSASLRIMARNVMELRQTSNSKAGNEDDARYAVTAEDMLPLVVLMLLKLEPSEVGKLFVELYFIADMMADFLSYGCHSYALTEFQIAFRVLSQTCDELEIE